MRSSDWSSDVCSSDLRVWRGNMQVYGADKVWRQLQRERIEVARCTVERLMRQMGIQGARRGKHVRPTISDPTVQCPLDRVNRQFRADSPNQLWVSDLPYVSNWQGTRKIGGSGKLV